MAGMSNEEYERVVEELRASKAHRGDPVLQGLIQSNACLSLNISTSSPKKGFAWTPAGRLSPRRLAPPTWNVASGGLRSGKPRRHWCMQLGPRFGTT